jgi:GLPGLI family protein
MKKIIITLLTLNITLLFSQQMYRAEYKFTDKNNFTTKSYLYTDNKEATFKIEDNRFSGEEINTSSGAIDIVDNDSLSRFSYSNAKESIYRFINKKNEVLYSDDINNKPNWIINSRTTKKIGKYNCTEAKTRLNGRDYTAWFTYDIPLKFGPLKFHKLPGLIVELKEDNGWLEIELTSLSKTKELKHFNKIKKYVLSKKDIDSYVTYEKKLTDNEVTYLLTMLARAKANGIEIEFLEDYAVNVFLDIPENLLSELKKYNK